MSTIPPLFSLQITARRYLPTSYAGAESRTLHRHSEFATGQCRHCSIPVFLDVCTTFLTFEFVHLYSLPMLFVSTGTCHPLQAVEIPKEKNVIFTTLSLLDPEVVVCLSLDTTKLLNQEPPEQGRRKGLPH